MVKSKVVLIADDSADDLLFYRRILTRIDSRCVVRTVRDGEEALDYLRRANRGEAEFPKPDLFILDLKMPRKGGFDVLADLQRRPELRVRRTVVLSSSILPQDAQRAMELGADGFLTKVGGLDELQELFTMIFEGCKPDASGATASAPATPAR